MPAEINVFFVKEFAKLKANPWRYIKDTYFTLEGKFSFWWNRLKMIPASLIKLEATKKFFFNSFEFLNKFYSNYIKPRVTGSGEKSTATFIKFFNAFFDFLDFIKFWHDTWKKINESVAGEKAKAAEIKFAIKLKQYEANDEEEMRLPLEEWMKSQEHLIESTRNPILASAFYDAYRLTYYNLLNKINSSPNGNRNIPTISYLAEEKSKAERQKITLKMGSGKPLIIITPNYLKLEERLRINLEEIYQREIINAYEQDINSLPSDHRNEFKRLVELKLMATRYEYTAEIINNNALLSTAEKSKELNNLLNLEPFNKLNGQSPIERLKQTTLEKEKSSVWEKTVTFLKSSDQKTQLRVDYRDNKISNINRTKYLAYKYTNLIFYSIIIIGAAGYMLYYFATLISAAAVFFTTGNPSLLINEIVGIVKNFSTKLEIFLKFISLAVSISEAGPAVLGFIRTYEKFKDENQHYMEAIKTNAILQANYATAQEEGNDKNSPLYQTTLKKANESFNLLKEIETRVKHYFKKLARKPTGALNAVLMYAISTGLILFANPFLSIIFSLIVFFVLPMKRYWSDSGQIKLRKEAQRENLLPKNGENADDFHLDHLLRYFFYVVIRICLKPLEVIVNFPARLMAFVNKLVRLFKPNPPIPPAAIDWWKEKVTGNFIGIVSKGAAVLVKGIFKPIEWVLNKLNPRRMQLKIEKEEENSVLSTQQILKNLKKNAIHIEEAFTNKMGSFPSEQFSSEDNQQLIENKRLFDLNSVLKIKDKNDTEITMILKAQENQIETFIITDRGIRSQRIGNTELDDKAFLPIQNNTRREPLLKLKEEKELIEANPENIIESKFNNNYALGYFLPTSENEEITRGKVIVNINGRVVDLEIEIGAGEVQISKHFEQRAKKLSAHPNLHEEDDLIEEKNKNKLSVNDDDIIIVQNN